MRTDRELLELAAKAAGMGVWPGTGFQAHMLFTRPAKADPDGKVAGIEWNPLTDDGDALRLAVKLRLWVHVDDYGGSARRPGDTWFGCAAHKYGGIEAAPRRAIVRAAAEIGAKMQEAAHA
ncbi:hypothetical protein [Bordetella pertussis]|uniref:hypothetical protein n=1 Tax=Bordetella pertussis TaxID=520 RepID=UPI0005E1316E|nr:hypothetical protein [Bordetella pertussis]CPQ35043.1 phage-related hypothetical protein [Bordetella pertussis]